MKKDIHPKFHTDTKVTCACGNAFETGSTVPTLHTEICSSCHPFYTGKQKLLDAAGNVDKFKKRKETAVKIKADVKVKKVRKARTAKK